MYFTLSHVVWLFIKIGIRMGHYWSVLLEQCSSVTHSNVPEEQLAGFEIIRNVVESFVTDVSDTDKYDPQVQAVSYESVKLMPYKGYTMALYLRSDKLTVCVCVRVCVRTCVRACMCARVWMHACVCVHVHKCSVCSAYCVQAYQHNLCTHILFHSNIRTF